jgi:hypothetical protein
MSIAYRGHATPKQAALVHRKLPRLGGNGNCKYLYCSCCKSESLELRTYGARRDALLEEMTVSGPWKSLPVSGKMFPLLTEMGRELALRMGPKESQVSEHRIMGERPILVVTAHIYGLLTVRQSDGNCRADE